MSGGIEQLLVASQVEPPPGWRRVRLRDLGPLADGDWILTSDYSQSGVRLLQVGDVGVGRFIGKSSRFISPQRASELGCTFLREGDILISRMPDPLGRACRLPKLDGAQITAVDVSIWRPDESKADPDYLTFFLNSDAWFATALSHASGATRPRISRLKLENQFVPFPPLAEQRRIAAVLRAKLAEVERARTALATQLASAKALPDAEFRQVFQGITPLHTGVAAPPAPPDGWRWQSLTILARLESGHTPSRNRPDWWGGDVRWLSLTDIRALDGRVTLETTERTNSAGIANSSARILPADTVALSRTASVGFVTVLGREMATSQDFVNWVCGPNLHPDFLLHLLRASRSYFISLSSGATHKTVYMPTLKALNVCVPDLATQRRLAAELKGKLATAAALRTALEAQAAHLAKLPAAFLREAFAGRL